MPPCFQDSATCGGHIIGADENGRDEFARLVAGGQVTLGVSLLAALMSLSIGVVLGAAMRYGGAVASFVIKRAADAITCMPAWPFLLVLALSVFDRSLRYAPPLWGLAVLLSAVGWPRATRLLTGTGPRSRLNQAARDWRNAILVLSTIDFLGYGVQPPAASWGNMLANSEANLQDMWWAAAFPGLCIFLAVFLIEIGRRAIFDTETAEQAVVS
jgi:peptide/nickel transport system permease protein